MWEYLTVISTLVLNKENYMQFIFLAPILIAFGGLAAVGYFTWTGSTLKFKKDK